SLQEFCSKIVHREVLFSVNGCGNFILQKGLPFFYLHKIFYTLIFNYVFINLYCTLYIYIKKIKHK
ncbi:hypothetical protein EGW37_07825, partial [Enterococcus faecium]